MRYIPSAILIFISNLASADTLVLFNYNEIDLGNCTFYVRDVDSASYNCMFSDDYKEAVSVYFIKPGEADSFYSEAPKDETYRIIKKINKRFGEQEHYFLKVKHDQVEFEQYIYMVCGLRACLQAFSMAKHSIKNIVKNVSNDFIEI